MLWHRPTKVLITGKSGSGKTTFFERYLLGSKDHEQILIYDHEGELGQRLGLAAAMDFEQLRQATNDRFVIFDPSELFPGRIEEAFKFWCEWCFEVAKSSPAKRLFACDELQKLTGTDSVTWELSCVLETGRRHGLDAVMISQAPNLIHNRIRNTLTEVVTFTHVDRRAIEWHLDLGFEEEKIRALKPGEFIALSLTSGVFESGTAFVSQ